MNNEALKQIIKAEIQKIFEAANNPLEFDPNLGAYFKKEKEEPKFPKGAVLTKNVRDKFVGHFKLIKSPEGEYKLFISPTLKAALDLLQRGRATFIPSPSLKEPEYKGTDIIDLSKRVSSDIPAEVRGMLKKNISKIDSRINMFPVNTSIIVDGGDIKFRALKVSE